ncbi:hypothetical protein pb186bvf_007933 [Paramecium bursaria]
MQQIDRALFLRDFQLASDLLKQANQTPYYKLTSYKVNKLIELNVTEHHLISTQQFTYIIQEIKDFYIDDMNIIDVEAIKYHLYNFVEIDEYVKMEQNIFDFEKSYDSFEKYFNYGLQIKDEELTRKVAYYETIYKLIQSPKQKNSMKFNLLKELMMWHSFFIKVAQSVQQNQEYYNVLRKPMKELLRLSVIQIINNLEKYQDIKYYMTQLIKVLDNSLFELKNDALRIAILYSFAKMMIPLLDQMTLKFNELQELITQTLQLTIDNKNLQFNFKDWRSVFEYIMFQLIVYIHQKKEHLFNKKLQDKIKRDAIDIPFIDQLWYYYSINFTQQTIKLNAALKKLLSHNIFSLINIYCLKYEKTSLMHKIIQDLMDSPFEDDILRMKMCVNLFITEDFARLHQLVQMLLGSHHLKDHIFRPVIVSLCALFTGVYLGKAEESLCFARLNLYENKKGILTQDTLQAQLGYCYYNLGREAKYYNEQQQFYCKSLEYLQQSLQINAENYLVQYNIAKLYSQMGDIKQGLVHIKEACKLNNGDVVTSILCALIHSAHKDNSKALKIVSQLTNDNPEQALLYLSKAAILHDIYLNNLENDKEYQNAQQMSKELTDMILKKHQKSKEIQSILNNMKKGLCSIAKQVHEEDQKDQFISDLAHLNTMQNLDIHPLTYINYRNSIFNSIDILINLQLFEYANSVLQLVDDGNQTNKIERLFYEGYLFEKQGNKLQAIQLYEEVLKQDFYHVRTMNKLGLLYLQQQNLQRASELLIAASKFSKTHENCIGIAMIHKKQGRDKESNEMLFEALQIIKSSPVLSFTLVPDKLFI